MLFRSLGTGRIDEALERAASAVTVGRDRGLRWGLPTALRALGMVRAAAGDPEGATEAFEEGVQVARETGSAFELGRLERSRNEALVEAS